MSFYDDRIPTGLVEPVSKSLQAALMDLGIKEDRGRPNRGKHVDKFQPQWVRESSKPGVPWCASAVCLWWFAGFEAHPLGKVIRSADGIKDAAKKLGRWHATPVPGDAFVLLHSEDHPGFDKGHTGIVLRVSEDGKRVQCIEGNARNAVRLIEREVHDDPKPGQILGFASPLPIMPVSFSRGLIDGAESPGGSTR